MKAEEIAKNWNIEYNHLDEPNTDALNAMKEYAKFKVEEALELAADKGTLLEDFTNDVGKIYIIDATNYYEEIRISINKESIISVINFINFD